MNSINTKVKYRVYSTIDRGPTIRGPQRYMRGCCHPFPVSKEEADALAKSEMSKYHVTHVDIQPTTDVI